MNESMLKSFMQVIAGLTVIKKGNRLQLIRIHVEGYIERNFGKRLVKQKLEEFNSNVTELTQSDNKKALLEQVCIRINKEFSLKQKFLLLVNIFNFYSFTDNEWLNPNQTDDDILEQVASWLKINPNDFLSCKYFAFGQMHHIPEKQNLLIIASENPNFAEIQFLRCEGIKGYILFLFVPSANILIFNYNGTSQLELNSKPIFSKHIYIFSSGQVLLGKSIESVYYGNVLRSILNSNSVDEINLLAINVSYNYKKSEKGIKNLSLSGNSGELIGIMGGSGVGKSTLLKLLSGNIKAQHGEILLNGQNVNCLGNKIKGIIGIMHQEESLVEELTVYENLYYSTSLSIGDLPKSEIRKIVDNKLFELDLVDCMNNRVGAPGNRKLSGGQRKRLAIAMEIIREPKILLVDEPTSGLSSSDSEIVMNILKNIALGGKLVIVNIHQPSSEIFKLFDSLIFLDRGGVPIFAGNPTEAILHFKTIADKVDKHLSGCECCGNIKPELIFDIVEERNIDELGQKKADRKFSPSDWHSYYQKKLPDLAGSIQEKKLPEANHVLPNVRFQFTTFFKRNLLAKLRNSEFIFLALLLSPILATLISVFLRYSISFNGVPGAYNLYSNPNLASFFLMCILASLFFGLILSCDDIFRDSQIIVREQYIGLSLKSFYNSKVAFLLLLSAYQTLAFSFIGSYIMEIKDISMPLWFILFSVSLFGNLAGLIVSSSLKSIVAIYILVPFLLIPQILFSGLVVRFDSLNSSLSSQKYVPLVGEVMSSRWAVEAIIVHFYVNNSYNKPLFQYDFQESAIKFRILNLIPELEKSLEMQKDTKDSANQYTKLLLNNGINLLARGQNIKIPNGLFDETNKFYVEDALDFIYQSKSAFANQYSTLKHQRDRQIEQRYPQNDNGRNLFILSKEKYHNKSIDDLVRNRFALPSMVQFNNEYIQKSDPIYQVSSSKIGRSHFWAPYKQLGNLPLQTYWYNLIAIWVMIIAFYFVLIFNIIPRTIKLIRH